MHPQEKQLLKLIQKAKQTEFGRYYQFGSIASYQDFVKQVPLTTYNDYKEGIERLKKGEASIFWPGKVQHFAVSTGTSGEGKHIPITEDRLLSDVRFRKQIVKKLLSRPSGLFLLRGKHISIPGSIETVEKNKTSYKIGEISGLSALRIPKWIQRKQVLNPLEAINLSVSDKVEQIINRSIHEDVRSITGAPTWIVKILHESVQRSGKPIHLLWPHLHTIISGGVAYAHYQEQIEELIGKQSVSVLEMYGASEGCIGYSDLNEIGWFTLMLENGAFYEGECLTSGEILPIWDWKVGNEYVLRVSSNTGLWRYPLKDKVMIRSDGKICITGRIGSMSDYYGEALTIDEVRCVLNKYRYDVKRITIAPVQDQGGNRIALFLECDEHIFSKLNPKVLDGSIKEINRHYAIRRESGTLQELIIQPLDKKNEQYLLDLILDRAQLKLPEIINRRIRLE